MASDTNRLSACDPLLCHCAKSSSLSAKNVDSCKKISGQELISKRLSQLPKIKARLGFDQRMAAVFAMEIERETLQRNRSWLKKHPKIKLPEIIADFKKDLL